MLPKLFKPENTYDLIRLGQDNDGGYLVQKDSLINAKSLISFGLSYDWTFEKKFFEIKDCPIHCYNSEGVYNACLTVYCCEEGPHGPSAYTICHEVVVSCGGGCELPADLVFYPSGSNQSGGAICPEGECEWNFCLGIDFDFSSLNDSHCFTWDYGDGTNNNYTTYIDEHSHIYNTFNGNDYYPSLTIKTDKGCLNTYFGDVITILTTPIAIIDSIIQVPAPEGNKGMFYFNGTNSTTSSGYTPLSLNDYTFNWFADGNEIPHIPYTSNYTTW